MESVASINQKNHIGFLDLVRGFLAFWVYYAHLKMGSIGEDVIWGSPSVWRLMVCAAFRLPDGLSLGQA